MIHPWHQRPIPKSNVCPDCGQVGEITGDTTRRCRNSRCALATWSVRPPTTPETTAMTVRPIPRAAERNLAALARAQKDTYTLEIADHGMAEAFANRAEGSRYQMWASAGGYIDGSREALLVSFSCQCKAGAGVYGITPCKHTALLAQALFERGAIAVDTDGAYVTTEIGLGAASPYTLAELLLPYATA